MGQNPPRTISRPGTAKSSRQGRAPHTLTARPSSASATRPPTAQRQLTERPRTARQDIQSQLDEVMTKKAAVELMKMDDDCHDDEDEILYVDNGKAEFDSTTHNEKSEDETKHDVPQRTISKTSIEARIKNKIATNFSKFGRAFRRYDSNHDGYFTADELYRACNFLGVTISMPEAKSLMSKIDTNGSGSISLAEFGKYFGEEADTEGLSDILLNNNEIANAKRMARAKEGFEVSYAGTAAESDAALKNRVRLNFQHLKDAFRHYDADKDNSISVSELAKASGVNITLDEAEKLMKLISKDGDDIVSVDEFMKYFGEEADDKSGLSAKLQEGKVLSDRGLHHILKDPKAQNDAKEQNVRDKNSSPTLSEEGILFVEKPKSNVRNDLAPPL